MSYDEKPEFQALQHLEATVKQVTEELAAWRRRAHRAETGPVDLTADSDIVVARARITELEDENEELRERIEQVRRRIMELLTRLRFLEEQTAEVEGRG